MCTLLFVKVNALGLYFLNFSSFLFENNKKATDFLSLKPPKNVGGAEDICSFFLFWKTISQSSSSKNEPGWIMNKDVIFLSLFDLLSLYIIWIWLNFTLLVPLIFPLLENDSKSIKIGPSLIYMHELIWPLILIGFVIIKLSKFICTGGNNISSFIFEFSIFSFIIKLILLLFASFDKFFFLGAYIFFVEWFIWKLIGEVL